MISADSKIGSCIARTFVPVCIIIQLWFIKREFEKRKKQEIHNQYEKWLNIFSMLAMIGFTIYAVVGVANKIPGICSYVWGLNISSGLIAADIMTMYQIVRLEYCFESKQVHSDRYGYPRYLFIILYIIGVVLILYTSIASWFGFITISIGDYGCSIEYAQYSAEIMSAPIFVYGIWDITVLLLYVIKVCQIKRSKTLNDAKLKRVNDKINFILKKIVTLTVTYETYNIIKSALVYISGFSSIASNIDIGITTTLSLILCYLMIEHNNEEYVKLDNLLCCKSSKLSMSTAPSNSSMPSIEGQHDIDVTCTKTAGLPEKIEQFNNEESVISVI